MAFDIEFTDEFEAWWNSLDEFEQEDINAIVLLLQEKGPALRRPHVGDIRGSRHANMKELVVQHVGEPYCILFAFNPTRTAILLIGGNKTGNNRWYEIFVPKADTLYDKHLLELQHERNREVEE